MRRTPAETTIENAPERPENDNDWDPDIEYKQDLRAKKQRIIQAARSMDEVDGEDAEDYLERELKKIKTTIGNRFYLDNHIARHPASDSKNKQIKIRRIGGSTELSGLEAITTRPQDVVVQSYNEQMAEVEYYVDGPAGGESEIVMSFSPENTYRWIKKNLRVVITD